jgi:hypothetical protein
MHKHTKITKAQFYAGGGFSNPRMIRVTRGKVWAYYIRQTL